ncbi:hypothetical protein P5F65_10360 [Clostridium perfringens]|nr:hypothetical protein [Clostridium perfringens]
MYKVETHDNSKDYFSNINIIESSLHITSNMSISNMIKEVKELTLKERWKVIDIESLIKNIYRDWNNVLNRFKLKAELRKIILILKAEGKNLEELKFIEDNIDVLTIDFINIIEVGIKDLSFINKNNIKEILSDIYKRLVGSELFKSISSEILNVQKAKEFYKYLEGYNGERINKIYFYNLNHIDLRRYLIIDMLKNAGFTIVFRIPYFNNLKSINNCWDKVYGDRDLFYITKNIISKNIPKYVASLENLNYKPYDEKVECFTYSEISDFRRDFNKKIDDYKNRRNFFTFYKDSLSSCLDKVKFDENHGFQSNIGRFLLNIYSVNLQENDVKLSFDLYRELITSGWIEYRGWNGIRLNSYLVDNSRYFNGVKSINEIIDRIYTLKELEELNELFEEDSKEKIKADERKRLLLNPFRAFGYNNPERYNITINYLLECTLRLKRFIIKALNEENGLIDLKEHFELLSILFRNQYITGLYNNSNSFEKKVLGKIWGVLKSKTFISDYLSKHEIREYFNISLSTSEKEDKDEEKDFGIDQLEGMILRKSKVGKRNGEDIIYISDLSFKAYDEYIRKKSLNDKILSNNDYEELFKASLRGRHRDLVLKGFELQNKSIKAAESYLRFSIANLFINFNGIKSFSWISNFRDDDMESILLKQIRSIYGIENIVVKTFLDFDDYIEERDIQSIKYYEYNKKELRKDFSKYPEIAYRDLDFCSAKFLYSSVLDEYPMYLSNFHEKLAFSSLISVLKNSVDDSYKNISKYIFPLFPQWTDVVKSNILTCEYGRKNIRDYKYFDGINYPKSIDSIFLLKSKYLVGENWKVRNRYNKGNFKAEEYYKEFIDEYLEDDIYNSGTHCSMCPHVYLCKKGEFLVGAK